jgi:hypothetical protein
MRFAASRRFRGVPLVVGEGRLLWKGWTLDAPYSFAYTAIVGRIYERVRIYRSYTTFFEPKFVVAGAIRGA